MLLPLLAAVLPVLLGASLAWFAGRRPGFLGPARALALGATLSVVLGDLLPEAFAAIGSITFFWFGLGLLGPTLVERSARRVTHHRGLDLLLLGLAAHQVGDGLQVGAAAQMPGGAHGIMLAIGLHSVPLVAVVALGHGEPRPRVVALRGGLLAGCTAIGVLVGWFGAEANGGVPAALPAVLGGLLLHALWHALEAPAPGPPKARLLELLAFGLGLAAPLLLR